MLKKELSKVMIYGLVGIFRYNTHIGNSKISAKLKRGDNQFKRINLQSCKEILEKLKNF